MKQVTGAERNSHRWRQPARPTATNVAHAADNRQVDQTKRLHPDHRRTLASPALPPRDLPEAKAPSPQLASLDPRFPPAPVDILQVIEGQKLWLSRSGKRHQLVGHGVIASASQLGFRIDQQHVSNRPENPVPSDSLGIGATWRARPARLSRASDSWPIRSAPPAQCSRRAGESCG